MCEGSKWVERIERSGRLENQILGFRLGLGLGLGCERTRGKKRKKKITLHLTHWPTIIVRRASSLVSQSVTLHCS